MHNNKGPLIWIRCVGAGKLILKHWKTLPQDDFVTLLAPPLGWLHKVDAADSLLKTEKLCLICNHDRQRPTSREIKAKQLLHIHKGAFMSSEPAGLLLSFLLGGEGYVSPSKLHQEESLRCKTVLPDHVKEKWTEGLCNLKPHLHTSPDFRCFLLEAAQPGVSPVAQWWRLPSQLFQQTLECSLSLVKVTD